MGRFSRDTTDLFEDRDHIRGITKAVPEDLPQIDDRSPPYTVDQLEQFLDDVASKAFKDDVLENGVVSKCVEYTAERRNQIRKSARYLEKAGVKAEHDKEDKVTLDHVERAHESLREINITEIAATHTLTDKAIYIAVASLEKAGETPAGEIRIINEHEKLMDIRDSPLGEHGQTIDRIPSKVIRERLTSYARTYRTLNTTQMDDSKYELNMDVDDLLDAFEEHAPQFEETVRYIRER